MDNKITLTDKLLGWTLVISLLATLLHTTIPSVICTAVHITVTLLVSAIHMNQRKRETAELPARAEIR